MLKNPVTAAMSQMSRSVKPTARSASRSASSISALARVVFTAKSHMARWRSESAAAR